MASANHVKAYEFYDLRSIGGLGKNFKKTLASTVNVCYSEQVASWGSDAKRLRVLAYRCVIVV